MNEGIIAARYARALLLLTAETGRGKQVCAQVEDLLDAGAALPPKLEPELERLVALMKDKGRENLLKRTLLFYRKLYCESVNLKLGHLTTAVPDETLAGRLTAALEKSTGATVRLRTDTDETLEGGFVLEIDDMLMDASVRSQIESIRRKLLEYNKRLV